MPYSSFTIKQVERDFGLIVTTAKFFNDVPQLPPSQWLIDLFDRTVPFAATLGTEKAR